ncbi:glycoside hydrolase domain-containing protein [Terribacillus sp. DMT04]|uniref:glycoside hydrolase domain-containing protein n=1 Tax=Terribacillus sp. DMT04 TaxID=2850441 RepID=UPI001C2BA0C0|nr:glycoside hydrolase domain-containing protein [Terribacillus sp. DMT04]QXE02278.1 DUF1906 domain-containing protein [Terribacillus sp. DMT04]
MNQIIGDQKVWETQNWLNGTYRGRQGYQVIDVNGRTGWSTMYALTRALQIELGIGTPVDSFGPTTLRLLNNMGPISKGFNENTNIVKIIQGGLYCKGYNPGGITGTFGDNTSAAISRMKTDMGLTDPDGSMTAKVFKGLLTMDPYVLLSGGSILIRSIQQWMNRKYINRENFYFMPCDGFYSRNVQKSLVYAIQYEQGLSDSIANGNFGPTTRSNLPTLSVGDTGDFVRLFQAAMIFNQFDVSFDGAFTSAISSQVKNFQGFTKLNTTGIADYQTWCSLLVSTGDPTRKGTACDTITEINSLRAEALKDEGYEIIGRYLVNVPGGLNKRLQPGELQTILNAGLSIFPIYQTVGSHVEYFTQEQGEKDGNSATIVAQGYGIPQETTIYFAVDYDAFGDEITSNIIPYFRGINATLGNNYNVGIYGPRNICIQVSNQNLAKYSFVSGMSTGFSGNLGYPLPENWSFDQISTITVENSSTAIEIDNNINSGRDKGVSYLTTPSEENRSFFEQLNDVQNIARAFDPDVNKANYLLTHWYRQHDYTSAMWTATSGLIDNEFVDYVNEQIGSDIYNITDPITGFKIGSEHLYATLSGELYSYIDVGDKAIKDFAGWAGDLATVNIDVFNNMDSSTFDGDAYECAKYYIGHETDGSFTLDDLLGDVDAYNIAQMVLNQSLTIYDATVKYYDENVQKRFTLFFENRFGGSVETLEAEVARYGYEADPVITAMRELLQSFSVPSEVEVRVAAAFEDVIRQKVIEEA